MKFTDTHTHLYDTAFAEDIDQVVERALSFGVEKMILPAEDSSTVGAIRALKDRYPEYFFCMTGVHPTSIGADNVVSELAFVEQELQKGGYIGVGEIGMDLYWDQTFRCQQEDAFSRQLELAKAYNLPVSVHCRQAMDVTLGILKEHEGVRGVMHCFSGSYEDARRVLDLGMVLGVGGTVTYKNNPLKEVLLKVGLGYIVLETDAPFLAPVPYRGKRNESSYIPDIAAFLAGLFGVEMKDVSRMTQQTVSTVFGI